MDLKNRAAANIQRRQSICIVFNGEIYNFQELRDQMIDAVIAFALHSDTEAIVHLYEEYVLTSLSYGRHVRFRYLG
ncbi:MAG: hypothetical protein R3D26_22195 [Cyanobacteriota/Melainabacteria group bacterium]